jgi:hypothetical protein
MIPLIDFDSRMLYIISLYDQSHEGLIGRRIPKARPFVSCRLFDLKKGIRNGFYGYAGN